MRPAGKESLRFAVLLILLLSIAAVAVAVTLNFMETAVPNSGDRLSLSVAIWTLSLGFMLIAGSFGLWAIHYAAAAEGLRRVSQLVEKLDFIRDGLLAYDRQGKIVAMNPAARDLFQGTAPRTLSEISPELAPFAQKAVTGTNIIPECELPIELHDTRCTLRFRAQPESDEIGLLLVNDITQLAIHRRRQRRSASIQLAGHLAQGIANDFNDLLCGMSGHLSLLEKNREKPAMQSTSLTAMQHCANRGIRLARQLIQLSNLDAQSPTPTTFSVVQHINNGIDLLSSSLDPSWTIERDIEDVIPPVNLPPSQLEHLVHSLGLVVAETVLEQEHNICIRLQRQPSHKIDLLDSPVAAQLDILALPERPEPLPHAAMHEEGVVAALAQTLISQAGGSLTALPSGRRTHTFRILLPQADPSSWQTGEDQEPLAIGLEAYTAGWDVLLCLPTSFPTGTSEYLERKQIKPVAVHTEADLLAAITREQTFDAVFLHNEILAPHTATLARVVQQIIPQAGIVILSQDTTNIDQDAYALLNPGSPPPKWIHAMIEARSHMHTSQHP